MAAKLLSPPLCPTPPHDPNPPLRPRPHRRTVTFRPASLNTGGAPGPSPAGDDAVGSPADANSGSKRDANSSSAAAKSAAAQPRLPPGTLRYRSISRKQARRQQQQQQQQRPPPAAAAPPKAWQEMTLGEKAMELYVGEKGMLFWLNKFAYASIFIIIGGWILFRFVGPSLGLYQLDAPPLAPTAIFKG